MTALGTHARISSFSSAIFLFAAFAICSSHAAVLQPRGSTTTPGDIAGKDFDYVIVGAGAAGLIVASRLSEDASVSVAVIEAGGDGQDVMDRILTPAMTYFNGIVSAGSAYDWGYQVNTHKDMWDRLPRGKILGGSTAVNAMYDLRASKVEHDAWASMNPNATQDWSWDGFYPWMKAAENFTPPSDANATFSHIMVNPDFHSQSGPIHASFPLYQYDQLQYWVPTLANLGVDSRDAQGGESGGAYITPLAIDPTTETRSYAKTGYFDPASSRSNLIVLLTHQATKINFDTTSFTPVAKSVEFQPVAAPESGTRDVFTVNAKKEVILCAGSIGSPHLLQLSGIGPRALLQQYNIPIIADLPGVGEQLQDHVQVRTAFHTSAPVTGENIVQSADVAAEQLALYQAGDFGASQYSAPNNAVAYVSLKDLLASSAAAAGSPVSDGGAAAAAAFVDSVKNNVTAYLNQYPGLDASVSGGYELTYTTTLNSILNSDEGVIELMLNNVGTFNPQNKTVAMQVGIQHPFSRGSVAINTTDPFASPAIKYNYLNHDVDRILLREGLKFARRVASTEPFSTIILEELEPGLDVQTDDQIDAYIDLKANSQYHPASSTAQLPQDKGGVVDSELKVYGVSGLRVIDAGIIPFGIGAHLMWPTYGIGEKGASIIKNPASPSLSNSPTTSSSNPPPASQTKSWGTTTFSIPATSLLLGLFVPLFASLV